MNDWDTFLNIVKAFLAFAIIIATITAFVPTPAINVVDGNLRIEPVNE